MEKILSDSAFIKPDISLPGSKKEKAAGFGETFKQTLASANKLQHQADQSIDQVVRGDLGVHEGMMAINNADLSLRMVVQVRNKVLDAYREIMRMQF